MDDYMVECSVDHGCWTRSPLHGLVIGRSCTPCISFGPSKPKKDAGLGPIGETEVIKDGDEVSDSEVNVNCEGSTKDEGELEKIDEISSSKSVEQSNDRNKQDVVVSNSDKHANDVIDVDNGTEVKNDCDMNKVTEDVVVSNYDKPANDVIDVDNGTEVKNDCDMNKVTVDKTGKSYAKMVTKDTITVTKNLMFIAPKVNENGEETILFDEDIVKKGRVKWQYTICGYFVGPNMLIHELRYHIRRIWSRFGLKEVIVNASGVNLFKFQNEIGMNNVLNQGPWMVNNRPLFVQKWNPEIGLMKVEPTKLPLWIKMVNIPMEAWSVEVGRADYARVLVEVEAEKQMRSKIKIEYIDMNKCLKGIKVVKVEYDWKPECCSHCKVFGHTFEMSNVRQRTEKEIQEKRVQDEFAPVQNRKKNVQQQNRSWQYRNNYNNNNQRQEYRKKNGENDKGKGVAQDNASTSTSKAASNGTSVKPDELRILKDRMVVDVYLNKKIQPTCAEVKNWTKDMEDYFNKQWDIDRLKEKENEEMNVKDAMEAIWNIRSMNKLKKQKEVKKLILEEGIQVCAILETHVKPHKLPKVCEVAFGNWCWISNVVHSQNGCRIVVSWDKEMVNVMLLHTSRQHMHKVLEFNSQILQGLFGITWYSVF
ncbi:hypothetical protein CTI12_AA464830 [Artemisia annua]|uniref:DUF4283 domain-containing protein n=1 Tax=Artemisia annua TaxID=35608 RepID=A0A2U1LR95_ARTAN|nr:hypothetical protein CTI12_AA464830 [Artemisia annua]